MSRPSFDRSSIVLAGLALALATCLPALAADHLDAPGLTPPGGDGRLDINDVYAFQSPADPDNAVLIMTINPAAGLLSPETFSPDASYEIRLDMDGDAKEDRVYRFTFGEPDVAGQQKMQVRCTPASRCPGRSGAVMARGRTGEDVHAKEGSVIRADLFDDPFFFDLDAFTGANSRSFCDGSEEDFFLGLNVSAIVLEIPRENLGTDAVGVWATTSTDEDGQVDRMGRPAINTVFIPNNPFEPAGTEPSQKNFFNAGKPKHDRRDFSGEVEDTLAIFYPAGDPTIAALTQILLPDILTVDFSSSDGFLNGRRLADDVIDAELGLVTNGIVTSDCVDNDSAFINAFPYLAMPN